MRSRSCPARSHVSVCACGCWPKAIITVQLHHIPTVWLKVMPVAFQSGPFIPLSAPPRGSSPGSEATRTSITSVSGERGLVKAGRFKNMLHRLMTAGITVWLTVLNWTHSRHTSGRYDQKRPELPQSVNVSVCRATDWQPVWGVSRPRP